MKFAFVISLVIIAAVHEARPQAFNPAILQDSRDLPKVDGAFGFLYRTEDGIAHAAKGEPGGIVHGRFTYTDPTGLKVNYNYNAGSRVTPKYNYNEPLSSYEQQNGNNQERRAKPQPPVTYREEQYNEPAPVPSYANDRQQYDYSQQTRSRPPSISRNSINNYEY